MEISDAQSMVKEFAKRNKWEDVPNIDKFDHIHEELIEMSQHLRYKSKKEMKSAVSKNRGIFEDGVGDLLFSVLRLANQLGIDAEIAFINSSTKITKKYSKSGKEYNQMFIRERI